MPVRPIAAARAERGQSTVELALILPVFLLLVFGVMDFAKAFNYWNDANHIAAEGARFAAVDRNPSGGSLQSYLQGQGTTKELVSGGTDQVPAPARVCIEFPNGTSNVGDPVKVTVSADYDWLPIVKSQAKATKVTLAGSATMRIEARPTNYSAGCS